MIHDEKDLYGPMHIGVLNLDDPSIDEQTIGSIGLGKNIGNCDIFVWYNEGIIPHFHIKSLQDPKWECCMCIYEPYYFNHGNKQGKLNRKQLSILDEWMSAKTTMHRPSNITNWELACIFWKANNNPMKLVPKNPVKPNYKFVENMKGRNVL